MGDLYLLYNRKKGINSETMERGDEVTVVQASSVDSVSELLTGLEKSNPNFEVSGVPFEDGTYTVSFEVIGRVDDDPDYVNLRINFGSFVAKETTAPSMILTDTPTVSPTQSPSTYAPSYSPTNAPTDPPISNPEDEFEPDDEPFCFKDEDECSENFDCCSGLCATSGEIGYCYPQVQPKRMGAMQSAPATNRGGASGVRRRK